MAGLALLPQPSLKWDLTGRGRHLGPRGRRGGGQPGWSRPRPRGCGTVLLQVPSHLLRGHPGIPPAPVPVPLGRLSLGRAGRHATRCIRRGFLCHLLTHKGSTSNTQGDLHSRKAFGLTDGETLHVTADRGAGLGRSRNSAVGCRLGVTARLQMKRQIQSMGHRGITGRGTNDLSAKKVSFLDLRPKHVIKKHRQSICICFVVSLFAHHSSELLQGVKYGLWWCEPGPPSRTPASPPRSRQGACGTRGPVLGPGWSHAYQL